MSNKVPKSNVKVGSFETLMGCMCCHGQEGCAAALRIHYLFSDQVLGGPASHHEHVIVRMTAGRKWLRLALYAQAGTEPRTQGDVHTRIGNEFIVSICMFWSIYVMARVFK